MECGCSVSQTCVSIICTEMQAVIKPRSWMSAVILVTLSHLLELRQNPAVTDKDACCCATESRERKWVEMTNEAL